MFRLIDVNNSGVLNYDDLIELFPDNTEAELKAMIAEVAPGGDLGLSSGVTGLTSCGAATIVRGRGA